MSRESVLFHTPALFFNFFLIKKNPSLPLHAAALVLSSSLFFRRPSAKCLLESQYFPPTVRAAYLFLSPFHLLAKTGHRLQYAAKLASKGALRAMGTHAVEMCTSFCLPVIMSASSNVEAESALCLLREFLKCLNAEAIKILILPSIQKILQVHYENLWDNRPHFFLIPLFMYWVEDFF